MVDRSRSRARLLVLSLVAASLLIAALGAWHGHDSSLEPCLLCHAAHVPALGQGGGPELAAPGFFCWRPLPAESVSVAEAVTLSRCPRAPPA